MKNLMSTLYEIIERGKSRRLGFMVVALVAISVACTVPFVNPDTRPSSPETAVARTIKAREKIVTGTAMAESGQEGQSSPIPASTQEAESTITQEPTMTPTQATPEGHVSANTNCRTGPGEVYERLDIVHEGQTVELFAQDPKGSFWFVTNPDNLEQKCWIWGNYVTPQAPTAGLPVYTPRPTPTPQVMFQASYLQTTGFSSLFMEFEIKNTGRSPLESISVEVIDKDTGETIPARVRDDFGKIKGEGSPSGSTDTLQPGKKGFAYSDFFPFARTGAAGHQMEATFRACTRDGLNGRCGTRTIRFKSQ